MSTNPVDEILTRRQAADLLGLEPGTLARWLCYGRSNNNEDRGPACVRGERGLILYRRSDVVAWAEARGLWPASGLAARPAPRPSSVGRRAVRRCPPPQVAPWQAPQAAPWPQAPQAAPWPQAPQAAPWQAPQAAPFPPSVVLGQSQAELGRVRAELADAERRCAVENILLCYLARMLSKTQSGFGRPVLVDVTNVIENANIVSREYMIIDHHKSKLWKVECPHCGDFASQELPHSKLTGLNPCECGARLLVVETSPWLESPVDRANATPTVSVLLLKSSKQGAK